MTWWEITIDTLKTGLKVFTALLCTGAGVSFGAFLLWLWDEKGRDKAKKYIRRKVMQWYREEKAREHKNRVDNAKAIEEWCKQDYYGEL